MTSLKDFFSDKWLIAAILIAYLFFQFPFLHFDLWNDEIYTLKYFTFVSPLQTVTDYHSTNNHVFFNLINNFYLRLIGQRNVYTIMDHSWLLRIVSMLYSLGTIFFTFKCCDKALGRNAAVLSIIFLCTTVPFLNFATQVRGYSLSMFLLTALSYCLLSYIENSKFSLLFWIAALSFLAVYSIPLNLYALAGIFVFLLTYIITSTPVNRRVYVRIVVALAIGILTSLLFYSPIIRQVFFNEVVIADNTFTFQKWIEMTQSIFVYFFSYRYWLIPLILIGFCTNIYQFIFLKK